MRELMLRTVLVGSLAGVGFLPPISASSDSAADAEPWNQVGAHWVGTVQTQVHRNYTSDSRIVIQDESASFSELTALDATANGEYTGRIVASGTEKDYSWCVYTNSVILANESEWEANRYQADNQSFPQIFRLRTDDSGTYFAPSLIGNPLTVTSYCTADGQSQTSETYSTVLGFEWGASGFGGPLPDSNPDPLRLVGSRTWDIGDPPYDFVNDATELEFTVTYDLTLVVGTLDDPVTLDVAIARSGGATGTITSSGGLIDCGPVSYQCSATVERGTVIRLAALPAETSRLVDVFGCDGDDIVGCIVTMNTDRHASAYFGPDWEALREPVSYDNLDPDRKVEVATNATDSAETGAFGCAASALAIGMTIGTGGTVAIGGAAAAETSPTLATQIIEETVGSCVEGLVGTIAYGMMLKIDPPDPQWRRVAVPTPYDVDPTPKCRALPGNCKGIRKAWKRHAVAHGRVTELREVMAVAANRFGNATAASDANSRLMHHESFDAYGGLLAAALVVEAAAGRDVVRELKQAGLTSVVVTKRGARKALDRMASGKGIAKSATNRALRMHLVTSRRAAVRDLKAQVRRLSPHRVNILGALRSTERTREMRRDAAAITLIGLQLVTERLQVDQAVTAGAAQTQLGFLEAARACDAGTAPALIGLATHAGSAASGLGTEGGGLVSAMATTLAQRGANQGDICQG